MKYTCKICGGEFEFHGPAFQGYIRAEDGKDYPICDECFEELERELEED